MTVEVNHARSNLISFRFRYTRGEMAPTSQDHRLQLRRAKEEER